MLPLVLEIYVIWHPEHADRFMPSRGSAAICASSCTVGQPFRFRISRVFRILSVGQAMDSSIAAFRFSGES